MSSYNGGVSHKGDKDLAAKALPKALQMANIVRGMKTAAGLDNFEKIFDLEGGGTVRVVDFAHVRHIYIDVTGVEEVEEEEAEDISKSTTMAETFIVHEPSSTTWTDPPLADMPPAMVLSYNDPDDGWITLGEDALLEAFPGGYGEGNAFKARHAVGWIGADGTNLHSPVAYPHESKYNLAASAGERIWEIYWHDHRLTYISSPNTILGYGIHAESKIGRAHV